MAGSQAKMNSPDVILIEKMGLIKSLRRGESFDYWPMDYLFFIIF